MGGAVLGDGHLGGSQPTATQQVVGLVLVSRFAAHSLLALHLDLPPLPHPQRQVQITPRKTLYLHRRSCPMPRRLARSIQRPQLRIDRAVCVLGATFGV